LKLLFTEQAWDDYLFWQENDRKLVKRINELIRDIQREPFQGIGKPEPLKFGLTGYWSRRVNHEHRLVYKVERDAICIVQCRYHYG
jgi:toxin YoeB